jgi:hypothetical protein
MKCVTIQPLGDKEKQSLILKQLQLYGKAITTENMVK